MEGQNFSRVKVQSILSAISSKPIEPGKVHQLSLLDQAMGLHTIHILFYYRSNPFNDGSTSSELDNLQISLSESLDEYPIATGRLSRGSDGGWQVRCNDAGVRILQASVNATLDEWLRSADASEEEDLTVWDDMPQDPSYWSPFRIQINNFICGGLAIGLSCTHMHADMTSATLLIRSWAEACCGQPPSHPPIFLLPLPTSSPTNSIPSFYLPHNATKPAKMGSVTMKFSSSVIQKCLSQVQNQYPNVTPFDVLAALFWSRIARCQEPSPPDNHKRSLSICVDLRNLGIRPVPYGYFGNAQHFSVLEVDSDNLLNGGLGRVSDCVRQHIDGLRGDDIWSAIKWLEDHKKKGEGPFKGYGSWLTCINMEHMIDAKNGQSLMYDVAFKEGEKPVHVSYHVGNVEGEGLIIVMPSAEANQGRTVTVVLPEEQIANLCKDRAILDLEPAMVISGKR